MLRGQSWRRKKSLKYEGKKEKDPNSQKKERGKGGVSNNLNNVGVRWNLSRERRMGSARPTDVFVECALGLCPVFNPSYRVLHADCATKLL